MEFKIIEKPALNFLLCYGAEESKVENMIEDFLDSNNIVYKKIYTSEFRVSQKGESQVAYMRYAEVPDHITSTPGFQIISVPASKYLSCSIDNMDELYGKNHEAEDFLKKNNQIMDMAKLAPMIEITKDGKNLIIKLK